VSATAGLAAAAVVAAALALPAAPADAVGAGTYTYVADTQSDSLTAIDASTGSVSATIPVGDDPNAVAVSANGQRAYVANFGSGTVSVVDTTHNAVTDTISMPSTGTGDGLVQPYELALSPDGSTLYVTDFGQGDLFVVDTSSNTVTATVPVGSSPDAVYATATEVYVANYDDDTVSVVDAATDTVTRTLPGGDAPTDLVYAASVGLLYVADNGSGEVTVVDTTTGSVTTTVAAPRVFKLAASPDGSRVYAATSTGIEVLQATDGSLMTTVDTGANGFADLAVGPDGRIYDAYSDNNLIALRVYDPATFAQVSASSYPGISNDIAIGSSAPAPSGKADITAKAGWSGKTGTYTITAKNLGPATAFKVGAVLVLPRGVTVKSASPAYSVVAGGRLLIWNPVSSLRAQASTSFSVRLHVTRRTLLVGAAGSLVTPDPRPFNNATLTFA
jgi:uncharacterized repeat protein (TIGR01451 family)